jgi:hypothetical protein
MTFKNYYLERLYLIVIFVKLKKLKNDFKDDDDCKKAKINRIYKDINDDVYIGSTCESFKKYVKIWNKIKITCKLGS